MDSNFLQKLLATFILEAKEHIQNMSNGLLEFENTQDQEKKAEIIETIYREAHSLKGASRAVNMNEIGQLCQVLEDGFSGIKNGTIVSNKQIINGFLASLDLIEQSLDIRSNDDKYVIYSRFNEFAEKLKALYEESQNSSVDLEKEFRTITPKQTPEIIKQKEKISAVETIRIAASKLDSLMIQAEEMISVKLAGEQTLSELEKTNLILSSWEKEWQKVFLYFNTLKEDAEHLISIGELSANDDSYKLLKFIEWNAGMYLTLQKEMVQHKKAFLSQTRLLTSMVNNLMEDVKKILMHPFSQILDLFPKVVRELSNELGKEIRFESSGGDIEIDRRILEEIKDPLIHIIRNCIDHGIEPPEKRRKLNKSPEGLIQIHVKQNEGRKVEIIIYDDGGGINLRKLKENAVNKKIITKEAADAMSNREAMLLMFYSGTSTSTTITDISGRGLGMAIVQEKVEKLGGSISIESSRGEGTKFTITLPLTLATFRGIIVQCYDRNFVIPTNYVDHAVRFKKENIKTVEGRETILVNDIPVALTRMAEVLSIPETISTEKSNWLNAIVLKTSDKRIAFLVDAINHEQEVLIKPFNKQLLRVKNIFAATILGDGRIVPVLNVSDLMKNAEGKGLSQKSFSAEKENISAKNVLIADDSITSRMLLKDILESSGFIVKTAFDGIDALEKLKNEKFDIVVSDVEMPKMTGFELVKTIRKDKSLKQVPVVLVTSLAKREDREKGISLGANAYIVKSSFDQSNLIDTIKSLLL